MNVFRDSLNNSWQQQKIIENIVFAIQDLLATIVGYTILLAAALTVVVYPVMQLIMEIEKIFGLCVVIIAPGIIYIMYKKWYFHFFMWYIFTQVKNYWSCVKQDLMW